MNKTLRFIIGFLVLILGMGMAQPCAAVSLRSETEVNRPTVRLSDVFDELPVGLDVEIARAPVPGKSITYNVNVLINLAHQYKLDWKPQGLGDHTTITTAATKITADDIRASVLEKLNDFDVKGDIDVLFDNRTLELTLPADRPANFSLNNFSYDASTKRFRSDLAADGFAGPINQLVSGRIVVRKNIPVLARRLDAGAIISASDIDWVNVNEERAVGMITSAEQLTGKELRRDMDADQPIRETLVMEPRLVTRGSLVTMKIETPYMVVTAQGRSLQDGKRGDVVRVTNTHSNRVIEGVIESSGVIHVPLTQKFVAVATSGKQ